MVIGAGHNGLSPRVLADAGWEVLVLEAQAEPGGAVKSAELTPGYLSDLYSAFCPLSVTSPALEELHPEDHGLRWTHVPAVVGDARSATDEDAPLIYRDIDRTAAELFGIIRRRQSLACAVRPVAAHQRPFAVNIVCLLSAGPRTQPTAARAGYRRSARTRPSHVAARWCDGSAAI